MVECPILRNVITKLSAVKCLRDGGSLGGSSSPSTELTAKLSHVVVSDKAENDRQHKPVVFATTWQQAKGC